MKAPEGILESSLGLLEAQNPFSAEHVTTFPKLQVKVYDGCICIEWKRPHLFL